MISIGYKLKKTVFTSSGRTMRGYDQPRCGQEEKQEESFYRSDYKEREEGNQVRQTV